MTKVAVKLKKGDVLKSTALKIKPGSGAIELASQYIHRKMDYDELMYVMEALIDGRFEGVDDKKVRRCACCGYFYRDKTKNNSSVVCSQECRNKKDTVIKEYRRNVRAADKPRRPTFKDLYYAEYLSDGTKLEYPFWASEDKMYEYDRKRGCYTYGDDFEEVVGVKLLQLEYNLTKRKQGEVIIYDSELGAKRPPFEVKFVKHSADERKTIDYPTVKKGKGEVEAELLERFGEYKLTQARRRARYHKTGNYFG